MVFFSASSTFPSVSTSGTILDLCSTIAQGDDYNQRFGSHVDVTHINVKVQLVPGSTANSVTQVRATLLKAEAGIAFAAAMQSTYSPVADSSCIRLYRDGFRQVAAANASAGYSTMINWSVKIRHRQKFSGTGAATTTGDSLFLIIQSSAANGTTCPAASGVVEVFFKP
jgi:hypothetical protein